MHIEVPHVPHRVLQQEEVATESSSAAIRDRVEQARVIQLLRSKKSNAQLVNRELEQVCKLSSKDMELLDRAIDKFGLSSRAYHRIVRIARTIADLEQSDNIQTQHLAEAINYRKLDRQSVATIS